MCKIPAPLSPPHSPPYRPSHPHHSQNHQAPELMKAGRLSKSADVFSFGVLSEWEPAFASLTLASRVNVPTLACASTWHVRLTLHACASDRAVPPACAVFQEALP